ncbi:MAG: peptidylprolyl isomerase [Hydrogenophaga sp.]|uniref:peptidylprolyl isomerase n=1 Tax=Hydrogenophaga sp. TaxID=1904254 RepID=UPI002730D23D|nr:peptidylprolyl isomerase [Hydrogenophaga sp.]MDP2164129.1 peptidylprolyl isomerase [Hydrogenophaga sp.]MDP3475055.1 peptidylprolyl isomerase [Hydrogenophaga sp.]
MNPDTLTLHLMRHKIGALLVSATLAVALTPASALAQSSATNTAPKVRITTSQGDIVLELYPDKAPKTVENFLQYVRDKHYDGTVFHRVISNFMVQGGGFDAAYRQKPTRAPILHEGQAAVERGGPRNVVGTVAMARTNDPHSASSQFFINVKDNAFLDPTPIPPGDPVPRFEYRGRVYENVARANLLAAGELYGYTVFGKVVAGMDVVNKIKDTPTGAGGPFPTDVPKTPITILKATLEK